MALTITDFDNAEIDLQTTSIVANSKTLAGVPADTTITRLGDTTDTLNGRLKKLGWQTPPISYASGIVLTSSDGTKVIERSGVFYAALPTSLPFTTTGTWTGGDEDDFGIILYSDASSTGLTVNSVYTNVESFLSNDFEYSDSAANIVYNGALPDGSDSLSAITAAAATGKTIVIPDGNFSTSFSSRIKYYGAGRVFDMSGDPAENFIKISQGDTNKDEAPMSCVIRQDTAGSGWYFIDDSGHEPNGFNAVAIDGADDYALILDHKETILKIGANVAVGDEWYAKAGIKFGTSVSAGLTKVFAHKDASFTVSNSSGGVTANGFFGSTITAVLNGDGTVTVTHPAALSGSDMPTISTWRPTSGNAQFPVVVSATGTTVTYAMYSMMDGYVYHSGGTWNIDTNASLKPTITADATGITITHNGLQSGIAVATARDGWGGSVFIDTNSSVSTKIVLRDYAGAVINPTVTPDNYSFYFTAVEMVQQEAIYGGVVINRANVAVKWDNLYGSTGNVWVLGSNAY